MSQIMKAFLGIFLMMFLVAGSAGILSAFMVVVDAQDMHAGMVDEAENSNFSPAVMADCFRRAEEAGYTLTVTLYYENREQEIYSSSAGLPESTSDVSGARLELCFPFRVSFFGIETEHTLSAYAR